jgi:hypothetical protein
MNQLDNADLFQSSSCHGFFNKRLEINDLRRPRIKGLKIETKVSRIFKGSS